MGTRNWSNFWDMSSDAGFRVIGSNINTALTNVNNTILTVTADTGQINWTTVTKPVAINTVAGYEIWKFTDSQGTYYFKLEYGTGNGATTTFSMWITIGTGSNGTGTITGIIGTRRQVTRGQTIASGVTNYQSHCCVVNGAFWLLVGEGSNATTPQAQAAFAFLRGGDSTGAITSDGWMLMSMATGGSNFNFVIYYISGAVTQVDSAAVANKACLVPFDITSTDFGSGTNHQLQCFRHQMPITPEVRTLPNIATYIATESNAPAAGTTTVLAVVGASTHTYYATGTSWAYMAANARSSDSALLIYE